MARKLQCAVRARTARVRVQAKRTQAAAWAAEMEELEREAARAQMEYEAKQYRKERERRLAEKAAEEARQRARKQLRDAAFDGQEAEMLSALQDQNVKIQVDDADENGFTALSEASAAGHVGSIQLLLSEPWGADPNTVGRFKRTPLWRATFANQREAALALLEGGADPRLRGTVGLYHGLNVLSYC